MQYLKLLFLLFFIQNLNSQDLNQNLLVYYDFNNSVNDLSGNSYDATINGATFTTDRNGNANSALYFDGVNDFISLPNVDELKPNLPVSFSFWIKYDSYSINDRELFNTSFEEDRNTGVYFNAQSSTGNFAVNYGDGSYSYLSSTRRSYVANYSIEINRWYHIVVVVSSANNMKIYVDCVDNGGVYSGSGGSLVYSDSPSNVGRHDRALGSPANYFKGTLDDFRYWDRALTEDDVYALLELNYSVANFQNPTTCNSTDGSITITGLIPGENYQISYDYESSTETILINSVSENEYTISNLEQGVYDSIVVINTDTGCEVEVGDVSLLSPSLSANITSTDPTGCSVSDGIITISDLQQNEDYFISYVFESNTVTETLTSNASGVVELTGLSSGSYQGIVIEELFSGCFTNIDSQLLESPNLSVGVSSTDPTICGSFDGSFTLSGLVPSISYTVSFVHQGESQVYILDSSDDGDVVVGGLNLGTYINISVSESQSEVCSHDVDDVFLDAVNDFVLSFEANPSSGCNTSNGSILISNMAPNTSYRYEYEFESNIYSEYFISDNQGEWVIDNLSSGNYEFLMVYDVFSPCSDGIGFIEVISIGASINASISSSHPTGCDVFDGTITISDLQANENYEVTYVFESNTITETLTSNASGIVVLTGVGSGSYESIVLEELSTGCQVSLDSQLLESPDLTAIITSSNPTGCSVLDGIITISDLQANESYEITYIFESNMIVETLTSNTSGVVDLTGLSSGSYEGIMIEELSSGCEANLDSQLLESPNFIATITHTNPTACGNFDGTITIFGLLNNEGYTVNYMLNSNLESIFLISNDLGEVILSGLDTGSYMDISITENLTGCSIGFTSINLECEFEQLKCFKTRPFFTPNNDTVNDTWSLIPVNYDSLCDYELIIFNRYGKVIKVLTRSDSHWDGTYNGKPLPSSDYWYVVHYTFEGNDLIYKSHFSLKR